MNFTTEEKFLYQVMKYIYDSKIPINFKGALVLKACMHELGYKNDIRHTKDIDATWNFNYLPSEDQLISSLQSILDYNNLCLTVTLTRMYSNKRSAGFEFRDNNTNELMFTMYIDINRPICDTKLYDINGIKFNGSSPMQMIADKIASVSSDKIFRRAKDLLDLFYFSNFFEIDTTVINQTIMKSNRTLGDFDAFFNRTDELKHAYDKYKIDEEINKPPFDVVYSSVKNFILPLIQTEKTEKKKTKKKQQCK